MESRSSVAPPCFRFALGQRTICHWATIDFMSLFETWSGAITVPELPVTRTRIGRNSVFQFPSRPLRITATLSESQMKGYRLLRTSLPAPFNQLLLRGKGVRRKPSDLGVLSLVEESDPAQWSAETTCTSLG